MRRKRRSINQINEEISFQIVRERLPATWVIHEYGPDYGIDCIVELFDYLEEDKTIAETLGETFFVQLKSSDSVNYSTKRVSPRENVEKGPLHQDRSEYFNLPVAKFQLEMTELLTVQAMGPAIPVLLILVDVTMRKAFFVCLNDYIDKVIIPEDPTYYEKASKVVSIPLANELLLSEENIVPLRIYGKRSKMYGAFGKFIYQKKEIESVLDLAAFNQHVSEQSVLHMLRVFAEASLRQDIWDGHDFWKPIGRNYAELQNVKERIEGGVSSEHYQRFMEHVHLVWEQLSNLSNMYEELVREWFMPTFFAQLTSYPAHEELPNEMSIEDT